jgi:ubiquinone/menaquinone biosynthesis C-methylase UbiE
METAFNCASCNANDWVTVKQYHLKKNPNKKVANTNTNIINDSSNKIHQIFFNVWFPNQVEVTLTSIYCRTCGFMCYSPRPDENDINAKYNYVKEKGKIGILHNLTPRALKLDQQRELFINKTVAKHHDTKSQSVLDVGGGDGRFLRPFLKAGCDCYVADFNPNPYPGVKRIGSTLNDISVGTLFDIVICSHVLEHVTDPGDFLRQLSTFLKKDGVVYIEIPLEVWQGIAIDKDPVTHINFFTVNSLKNALLLNGLTPLSIESKFSTYNGVYKRVAWAVASVAKTTTDIKSIYSNTQKHIQPNPIFKLLRYIESLWLKILNLPG